MKIGINALYIKWGINAGTETYFTNIVKPWYENKKINIHFVLYCNEAPPWWDGEKNNFKIKIYPKTKSLKNRIFTEQAIFPFSITKKNVDVFFNPGYVGIVLLKIPQVTIIHDGFAWVYPKEVGWYKSIYWGILIPMAAKRAKKIIAVSGNTKNDVVKFCGVDEKKIEVIYAGGSHFEKKSINLEFLEKNFISPKSFVHCVGFFKDIKNPIRILEAYKLYKSRSPFSKIKLVLLGHVGGARAVEILKYAKSIDGVVNVGRISDAELIELYSNSLGLIFPSLYEGFGIPILEAQSFNCPVVTSNVSSMPEVAGAGALLVDPLSVDEIARAIYKLEHDDMSELIASGHKNLKRFSWPNASEETLEILTAAGCQS